jgi:hypothetical protein
LGDISSINDNKKGWSFLLLSIHTIPSSSSSSSSSFIKPPANGHHRWSGAGKKNTFS